ncbi:LAFA_0F03488g1_1 [Lachancea sp. 'fantastica']|nr:LAFA_0F03488g1_1 [Lachancea sp. 'fantastica']
MATTELVDCFEQDAQEYLGRLRFRSRLRSWLSGSTTSWASCLERDKFNTAEYSYDTEQLELLLILNGLKSGPSSSAAENRTFSPVDTESSNLGSKHDQDPHAEPPQRSKRRVFELVRRFRKAMRRSRKADEPQASSTRSGDENYMRVLEDSKKSVGSESLSSKHNSSQESCVAPSTNVLSLLQQHPGGYHSTIQSFR